MATLQSESFDRLTQLLAEADAINSSFEKTAKASRKLAKELKALKRSR